MRLRLAFVLGFLVVAAVAAAIHWAAWRWSSQMAPRWTTRHRRPQLALFVTLFCLPAARALVFVRPGEPLWPMIAAAGMLWHLTLSMTVALVALFRAGRAVLAKLVSRRRSDRGERRDDGARKRHVAEVASAAPALFDAPRDDGTRDRPLDAPRGLDRRRMLEQVVGGAAFAASAGMLGWGTLRGRYEWVIEEVPIRIAKLPKALDGFTIVQLSDLHVGTFIGERELAMGLGLLARLRPDLIAITGDIVDADPRYVPLAARRLGALEARHGVVCIPGNHDYYTGEKAVLGGMRRAGIDVLVNRGKIVAPDDGGGLALLGVDDLYARLGGRANAGPDLALARATVPPERATVLLAHQPQFAATAAGAGIDLQLSGHTHGGQINPGIRPVDFLFRWVQGRYDVGDMQLYVNRGFGTVGPPTRVGAAPEITKIVLVAG